MPEKIIGVVGQIGAGKDTTISLMEKRGFANFSLSDQIRIELRKQGNLNFTREDIQKVGNEMREKHGDDFWARQAWNEAQGSGEQKVIISSIRHPAEVEFLKQQGNFSLLAVVADQQIRFERKQSSTRTDDRDILNWKEFREADRRETERLDPHGQLLTETLALADYRIENNGTLTELEQKVCQILAEIERSKSPSPQKS